MSPIGESRLRIEFHLKGVVQGIGLRPKILRLARQKGIFGSVANCGDSVLIRAQSQKKSHLDEFLENIKIWGELGQIKETSYLESEKDFRIEQSHSEGIRAPVLSPDTAICDLCRAEFYDFNSRRYGYHFISCAECGPRLSIAARTPYDRDLTSWRKFPICQECRREYEDPLDRRFHVEGISCPQCGPTLSLLDSNGEKLSDGKLAIDRVCKELRAGKIIAVKGMTGFHLMVDARNSESLQTLRRAKNRPSKPFALMVANRDEAKKIGVLDSLQTQAFESSIAPIVLVDKVTNLGSLSAGVAPHLNQLGIMRASSGYHLSLLNSFGFPLVATSGNRGDEPICYDIEKAIRDLKGICDFYLDHNLEILHPSEDSIVQIVLGEVCCLRRAKGYSRAIVVKDLEIEGFDSSSSSDLSCSSESIPPRENILAMGADMKSALGVKIGKNIVLSSQTGTLGSMEANESLRRVRDDWIEEYSVKNPLVCVDCHPDYYSSLMASEIQSTSVLLVQHHCAHIASVMAERELLKEERVLGFAWDGTGYGCDGTSWGGEVLSFSRDRIQRLGSLFSFPLLGGNSCSREAWRLGFALARESGYSIARISSSHWWKSCQLSFSGEQLNSLAKISPRSTSMGRFFDGVASFLGIRQIVEYEGQAAIELQDLAEEGYNSQVGQSQKMSAGGEESSALDPNWIKIIDGKDGVRVWDWRPYVCYLFRLVESDVLSRSQKSQLALQFHLLLACLIEKFQSENETQMGRVPLVLSGGVFQNKLLIEFVAETMKKRSIQLFWNKKVPANDGGIALGQIVCASKFLSALKNFQMKKPV